jgi:hypothetical protein
MVRNARLNFSKARGGPGSGRRNRDGRLCSGSGSGPLSSSAKSFNIARPRMEPTIQRIAPEHIEGFHHRRVRCSRAKVPRISRSSASGQHPPVRNGQHRERLPAIRCRCGRNCCRMVRCGPCALRIARHRPLRGRGLGQPSRVQPLSRRVAADSCG